MGWNETNYKKKHFAGWPETEPNPSQPPFLLSPQRIYTARHTSLDPVSIMRASVWKTAVLVAFLAVHSMYPLRPSWAAVRSASAAGTRQGALAPGGAVRRSALQPTRRMGTIILRGSKKDRRSGTHCTAHFSSASRDHPSVVSGRGFRTLLMAL